MSTVAVGLLRDLPPKRVMRAHVAGQDLVVWRATNGDIAAWDNRCPHRGMALSHGFVRGNALACLYHGWHYGSSGTCSYIPAHPDLTPPDTIQTRKFSVADRGGVIWVNTQGLAEPQDLPMACAPVRSFNAEVGAQAFRTACMNTGFDSAAPEQIETGFLRLGTLRVLLLENPLGEDRTQITVLTEADATTAQSGAVSRWCEAVCRQASQVTTEAA